MATMKQGSAFTYSQSDLEAYNRGWARFMVDIFKEQIDALRIPDTNALNQSIRDYIATGSVTTIEHKFLEYGIYVAAGVGNGFRHGNGGDLAFMGDSYRANTPGYGRRQVGAGLSEEAMLSPKFERVQVQHGRNAGKWASLTSGNKRQRRDWFFKKYYYSLQRLNETNATFYGEAYQGLMSSFLEGLFSPISSSTRIRSNRF